MKAKIVFLILLGSYLAGCSSLQTVAVKPVATRSTDFSTDDLSRSEYYRQLAVSYGQEGNTAQSIENYRLALLHNPRSLEARIGLADEYRNSSRTHLALVEYNQVLEQKPDSLLALSRLGELYVETRVYSKAREVYAHILNLQPQYDPAKWALVEIYKFENNYQGALDELEDIELTQENRAQVFFEQAQLFQQLKNQDKFDEFIQKAYSANPRDRQITQAYANWSASQYRYIRATEALSRYAETQDYDREISWQIADRAYQAGLYDRALVEYNKIKNQGDEEPLKLDLRIAGTYFVKGDQKNAEKNYREILNYTESSEAQYHLAQILLEQKNRRSAFKLFEKVPYSSEYFGDARSALAFEELRKDNSEKALAIMAQAYELRPDQESIARTYSELLVKEQKYVTAAKVAETGLKEFPYNEELRLNAAYSYYKLGQFDNFNQQIRTVEKLNPESAGMYALLAELWYQDGKKIEDTTYLLTKALEYKSQNKNLKPMLAWLLLQQNHTDKAVALMEDVYDQNPQDAFYARALAKVYAAANIQDKAQQFFRVAAALDWNTKAQGKSVGQRIEFAPLYGSTPSRMPAQTQPEGAKQK
ncbi:tetratricopeptide repeat protein [Pseudobdellovibrio exovorus]|uniref:Uncharacterized protein n=1 Tax=Pseudobdellovibrio exovorus JSS TaxID=1184267 RepID=M4VAH3_9BACT|nr:tetratricopeptide repeat protein [Pseudobdellovibrio exovorus]AGH96407.1 hypothetical protein A11Q_2191 [Pseudobdellovibrio exovorus JSS]